jgi:hypothetical protein
MSFSRTCCDINIYFYSHSTIELAYLNSKDFNPLLEVNTLDKLRSVKDGMNQSSGDKSIYPVMELARYSISPIRYIDTSDTLVTEYGYDSSNIPHVTIYKDIHSFVKNKSEGVPEEASQELFNLVYTNKHFLPEVLEQAFIIVKNHYTYYD